MRPAVKLLVLTSSLNTHEIADLKKEFGYNKIQIKRGSDSITSVEEVIRQASDCDIIVAVLPEDILVDLVNPDNNAKAVIQPIRDEYQISSEKLTTEQLGSTCWEQVLLSALAPKG